MKAFLEKIGGEWLDDFVYCSQSPLKLLGYEIIPFDGDNMDDTLFCYSIDKNKDIILGSVQACTKFYEYIKVEIPKPLGYPSILNKFYKRKISSTTIEGLKDVSPPYFVKPKNETKLFTGLTIEKSGDLEFFTKYSQGINDTTEVYLSETVNFISEYRCFIFEGEIKGIRHYSGDCTVFPNSEVIDLMVEDYSDIAPTAYSLDVGITSEGKTIIVELNDMWAIGSYGFDSLLYVKMCIARHKEMITNNPIKFRKRSCKWLTKELDELFRYNLNISNLVFSLSGFSHTILVRFNSESVSDEDKNLMYNLEDEFEDLFPEETILISIIPKVEKLIESVSIIPDIESYGHDLVLNFSR